MYTEVVVIHIIRSLVFFEKGSRTEYLTSDFNKYLTLFLKPVTDVGFLNYKILKFYLTFINQKTKSIKGSYRFNISFISVI